MRESLHFRICLTDTNIKDCDFGMTIENRDSDI